MPYTIILILFLTKICFSDFSPEYINITSDSSTEFIIPSPEGYYVYRNSPNYIAISQLPYLLVDTILKTKIELIEYIESPEKYTKYDSISTTHIDFWNYVLKSITIKNITIKRDSIPIFTLDTIDTNILKCNETRYSISIKDNKLFLSEKDQRSIYYKPYWIFSILFNPISCYISNKETLPYTINKFTIKKGDSIIIKCENIKFNPLYVYNTYYLQKKTMPKNLIYLNILGRKIFPTVKTPSIILNTNNKKGTLTKKTLCK